MGLLENETKRSDTDEMTDSKSSPALPGELLDAHPQSPASSAWGFGSASSVSSSVYSVAPDSRGHSHSKLPSSVRVFFISPLLDGLNDAEQSSSIYCTQALMETMTFDAEEKEHFDEMAHDFKAADLSQSPSLTRAILKFIEKDGICLERLHVSVLDSGIASTLPRSLRVLVVTGEYLTDQLASVVHQRCEHLRFLSLGGVSRLSDDGWRHLLSIASLERLLVRADKDVPTIVHKSVATRDVKFELVFSLSLRVLAEVRAIAEQAVRPLVSDLEAVILSRPGDVEAVRSTFNKDHAAAEAAALKAKALVPSSAANAPEAIENVGSSFLNFFWREVDLTTALVARKLGRLPRFFRSTGEARTGGSRWSQAECLIRFPRPLDVSDDDWDLSGLVTGLTRTFISRLGRQWVSHAAFLSWAGQGCKALDLSYIPVTDADLAVLTRAFPHLQVLILASRLLTSAGVLGLAPFKNLKFLQISGVPYISPTVLRSLEKRGVVVKAQSMTQELTDRLQELARSFGEALNHECERCLSSGSDTAGLAALREFVAGHIAKHEQLVDGVFSTGGLDLEIRREARVLFLKHCAQVCNTLALELVTESPKAASFVSADALETLWITHLAALFRLYEDGGQKHKAPNRPPMRWLSGFTVVGSSDLAFESAPDTDFSKRAATSFSPRLPLLGVSPTEGDEGGDPLSEKGVEIGEEEARARGVTLPGLTAHKEALFYLFGHAVDAAVGSGKVGKVATPLAMEDRCVAALLAIAGKATAKVVVAYVRDKLVPAALKAREATHGLEDDAERTARPSFRKELRGLLTEAAATGRKVAPEAVYAALARAHGFDSTRHSIESVVSLCRRIRSLATLVSSYWSQSPMTRLCSPKNLGPDQLWLLWRMLIVGAIAGYLAPFLQCASGTGTAVVGLMREVVMASLVGEDPILLANIQHLPIRRVMEVRDEAVLWDAAVHSVEPRYGLSSTEALLSLEENWKSWSHARLKPDKPRGMPSRDYFVSRVLSTILRQPRASWTAWESMLWDIAASDGLLTALDLSELDTQAVVGALDVVSSACKSLTHLSLQGTRATWAELRLIPPSVIALALSDCCMLRDQDLLVLAEHLPKLEALLLRGCDEITDVALAALDSLPHLRFLDLSGAFRTTAEGHSRLQQRGVRIRFTPITPDLMNNLIGDVVPLAADLDRAILDAASLESAAIPLANLVRSATEMVAHRDMPDDFRKRVLAKSLHRCLSFVSPLTALVVERCGLPVPAEVPPLSEAEWDHTWQMIFENLPPIAGVEKPEKPEGVPWKRHVLEFYIPHHAFGNGTENPLGENAKKMLWSLAIGAVKVINATGVMHAENIGAMLGSIAAQGLTLEELHVSAEVITGMQKVPAGTKKVVVHGGPIMLSHMKQLQQMFGEAGVALVLPHVAVPQAEAGTSSSATVPSPSPREKKTRGGELERESWSIAAALIAATKHIIYEENRSAYSAASGAVGGHTMDQLYLAVKTFGESVDRYCAKRKVSKADHSATQFFFHCVSWLDIPQLILLERTGVLFRLEQNQLDHIWSTFLGAGSSSSSSASPPPPAGVPLRDWVIGTYVSSLLQQDAFDVMAAFVLQYCQRLFRLDLSGVDAIPQVEASVHEIAVVGSEAVTSFALVTLPSAIKASADVKVLRLTNVEDLSDQDLLFVVQSFTGLESLVISDCHGLSEAGIRAVQESVPQLNITWSREQSSATPEKLKASKP